MANVHGKALKPFAYKGKEYKEGDDVTMTDRAAITHEKLHYVKFNREEAKKIEAAEERKEAPVKQGKK
jgi:hypothetical protein